MAVLRYRRGRLFGGALGLLAAGALLALSQSVFWMIVAAGLLAVAVRMLYLMTTDLVAVSCEDTSLKITRPEFTRRIPWDHYAGAELRELTTYMFGFVPVSRAKILVFKSKAEGSWFTRKQKLGFSMLDITLDELPAAIAAIDRFAASRRKASVLPETDTLPHRWQQLAVDGIAAAAANRPPSSGAAAVGPASRATTPAAPRTPLRTATSPATAPVFGKRR
ncbi:MAG: hypothetical protein R3D44_02240 [Hyphomicrobiaceae bacterium]